ncbi:MAG: hypothetical protein QXK65_02830 [Candidatus Micrarchaeaceae archaeon]
MLGTAAIPISFAFQPLQATPVALLASSIPLSWEGIAIIASLVTILVAALVFSLASVINSPEARTWSRMQIYEALLSIVMLIIFSAFAYLFLLNPVNAFSSIGLLPSSCTSSSGVNSIFTLSACDLSTFNNYAFSSASALYIASYVLGLAPGFEFKYAPYPQQPTINVRLTLNSLFSTSMENILTVSFNAVLFMLVLNQIQLLLISSSFLLLFIFFALGIIARTFGFSRSFGGVMIAFAIGLGLIYPLLVSITYGFLDTQIPASSINAIETLIVSILLSPLSIFISSSLASIFSFIGYLVAGMTFIPFLNFLILDAFIVDFSSAIGERVSFMSLISGFV